MAAIQPIDLDQLSIYFDGVRWEPFPSVPVIKTFIFHRQDNESYEMFTHRVYEMCNAMNASLYAIYPLVLLEQRLETLEKAFSHCQEVLNK